MPAELSGGMQKRVALARVLVYRPKIILYDEPTEGLDPITKEQINALIVNTQKTIQSTAIVVTHDMYSAMSIADNIALLNQGKIAYIADPKNFIEIQDPIIQSFCHSMCKQRNLHA
jgi:phospholipid/cholesterol/gamma-HCH transport system ATP-binding protein